MSSPASAIEDVYIEVGEADLRSGLMQPLKLPLFEDPRKMNRRKILAEIEKYNNNSYEETNETSNDELVAILYELIVEHGKSHPINPTLLHDEQPEKWRLLSEQLFRRILVMEEGPDVRVQCMERINKIIQTKTFPELVIIANTNDGEPIEGFDSNLERIIVRFSAAAALTLHVLHQAQLSINDTNGLIHRSVTLLMVTLVCLSV